MRITLLCLLCSPPTYQRLKAAVKDVVKQGVVSEPISYAEAKSIPYLRVCLTDFERNTAGSRASSRASY